MGQLYEAVRKIEAVIQKKGLPTYRTKGQIAMRAGFVLSLVEPGTPDDAKQIQQLLSAAKDVLGEPIV